MPMTATYNEAVWNAIDRAYRPLKCAEKLLAKDAGATPKAARNWLDRQCAPNGENLVSLMASCVEVADEVLRLVEERKRTRGD